MNKTSSLAALVLLGNVSASELQREPLLAWSPKPLKNAYPKDYFVPNFGVDEDIATTHHSKELAEKALNQEMEYIPKKQRPKSPPRDYFVPNFGQDEDIKTSINNLDAMENKYGNWDLPEEFADVQLRQNREPLLSWKPKAKKDAYPKDYFVPNFGVDHDIANTHVHREAAEKALGHVMTYTPKKLRPKSPPRDYFVPHFGQDEDIKVSIKNLNDNEAKYGKWDLPKEEDLQLEASREPLLSWKPKPKKNAYPKDYFVPNFGIDHEIADTHAHEAAASATLKHVWTPKQDKDDSWILPTAEAEFKLVQTESELDREPLLSWKPKKKKHAYPKDYFVPNFGMDEDIAATQAHEAAASAAIGHVWTPVQDEEDKWELPHVDAEFKLLQTDAELDREPLLSWKPKKKKHAYPKDYFVPNFGVDSDIQASHDSVAAAEARLGHRWELQHWGSQKPPVEYDIKPLDSDIQDSLTNLNNNEAIYGTWDLPPEEE